MLSQIIRERLHSHPLRKLDYVQRKAERSGAITLSLLTSPEYLKKTKSELSSSHFNLIERVKELEWENKCLDWECVLYGGFESAYLRYAQDMQEHVQELSKAWQRERHSNFTKPDRQGQDQSVLNHINNCQSKLREVLRKQDENIEWYKKLWIPIRENALTSRSGKPHKNLQLRRSDSAMKKALGTGVDFSTQIEKLVRTKSGLIQSLAYKYEFVKLVKNDLSYVDRLLRQLRVDYYSPSLDGLTINEQAFENTLRGLNDWATRSFDVMVQPEYDVFYPEASENGICSPGPATIADQTGT